MIKYIATLIVINIVIAQPVYAETGRDEKINDAKKHFSFAVQNKNIENYEESQRQYEKSLAFFDSLNIVHYSYGDLLVKMGKIEMARQHFLKSLLLNPEHFGSAAILARLYYEKGDYDSSLVMYEHMYELKPDNNDILASVAGLREYLGRDNAAFGDYEKLIESGEDSYDNLMHAAKLALKLEKNENARHYAVMALEKEHGDSEALKIAGKISAYIGEWEKAAGFYRQLAESESTSVEIIIELENIYHTLSDDKNLIWALERHHSLETENVEVLGELSELYYAQNMLDSGIEYVNKGLKLNPEDGRFHILLGEYYRAQGQIDKALEQYRIALKDEKWKSSAQRLIWQIEIPETEEEKAEKEFFGRGKNNLH